MISNYSLYYSYKEHGDTLFIKIRDGEGDLTRKSFNNIEAISDKKGLVCLEIHQINKILKIKSNGYLFLPNDLFIDIINGLLSRYNLETLSYIKTSGYFVGKAIGISDHIASIEVDNRVVKAKAPVDLVNNDIVVVALTGALLKDGTRFRGSGIFNSKVCFEDDLYLSDKHEIIKLENNELVGQDFLKMEAI